MVAPAEETPAATPTPTPTPTPIPTPTPVATATPAVKARFSVKTARDDQYNKPVYFESMDNLLPTMDLDYELTETDLRVGDVHINDQSFFFALLPVGKLHPKLSSVVGNREAAKPVLVMRWPEALQAGGKLEVIARTGAVLWKEDVSEARRQLWKEKLDIWKKGLEEKGVKTANFSKNSVFGTQYGVTEGGFRNFGESFRFCLSQTQGRAQSRLCSQRYVIRGSGNNVTMSKIKSSTPPRVLLQSQAAPLKQQAPVSRDMPTSFFAELGTGVSYEFMAIPNKLNLMDLSDSKKSEQLRIVAWGTRPTAPSKILNPDDYSSLTKAIGFEPTIGDMRKFWEAQISSEDPKVYLPGQGGGLFTQRFELAEIPRAQARPYLDEKTPTGTYYDDVKVFGKKLPEVKVTSLENSIEVDSDPKYFLWRFKALDRGEMNRAYLSMEYQGKEFKAFHEIYKGFPRELSLRLSGLLSPTGQNVFLGEAAYNQWFESLLGWTNYWVGRQRWGISARHFTSITKLKVSSDGTLANISVTNADLKYRLSPGLWGRDETVGFMADYQSVTFGNIKAPMMGLGIFWGRSMPKVFDNVLNVITIMRYPKWVDMEFIFYPASLDKNVTLKTNFALNFHGKVHWTKHWFGEAGFGLKRYAIVDQQLRQKAELNTFYGTIGVGLNF